MSRLHKSHDFKNKLIYTIFFLLIFALAIVSIIAYMYNYSETEAFEKLRLETVQYKSTINLQMQSDKETLHAMADLLDEHDMEPDRLTEICREFKSFGMCENIGFLLPGDIFITKHGILAMQDNNFNFAQELRQGEYISGRASDITNSSLHVVRSAVHVKDKDGSVMAILYGAINSDKLEAHYAKQTNNKDTYLCIYERDSGNFIIDTKNEKLGNIYMLGEIPYKGNFSYNKMMRDINNGTSGYTSFLASSDKEYLYVRYSSLNVSNWNIMLAQPESVVFAGMKSTISFLAMSSALILFILLAYVFSMLYSIRKMLKINSRAADIRKHLLEINHRGDSIYDALRELCVYARARSTFIIDNYSDVRHYVSPDRKNATLTEADIKLFNRLILDYADIHSLDHVAEVSFIDIVYNSATREKSKSLYNFMTGHKILRINCAFIKDDGHDIAVLGAVNPVNGSTNELIRKIAVCFSMAISNQKHLKNIQHMALTDPLTGVSNRMAYTKDVISLEKSLNELSCVYIDINELHAHNNTYGHASGDKMIVFILETFSYNFYDCTIYRMGGDEFLIICKNIDIDDIKARIETALGAIEAENYHVSVGLYNGSDSKSAEEMVNRAEKEMYSQKAKYYQAKEHAESYGLKNTKTIALHSGIPAVDACLSVMRMRYSGIYCVSLDDDHCRVVLAPSNYMEMSASEVLFSQTLKDYIYKQIKPEYHRGLLNFLEYEPLRSQLSEGTLPCMHYEKLNGEKVILKVFPLDDNTYQGMDSLWVFEKEVE